MQLEVSLFQGLKSFVCLKQVRCLQLNWLFSSHYITLVNFVFFSDVMSFLKNSILKKMQNVTQLSAKLT